MHIVIATTAPRSAMRKNPKAASALTVWGIQFGPELLVAKGCLPRRRRSATHGRTIVGRRATLLGPQPSANSPKMVKVRMYSGSRYVPYIEVRLD